MPNRISRYVETDLEICRNGSRDMSKRISRYVETDLEICRTECALFDITEAFALNKLTNLSVYYVKVIKI